MGTTITNTIRTVAAMLAGTTMTTTPRTAVEALPVGFRFHPTDEELIVHYLRRRAASAPCPAAIIAEVDIYKKAPWDLPSMAASVMGNGNEWYFFCPCNRKYPYRPKRATEYGYWKAMGIDKHIFSSGEVVGVKKVMAFYLGRPPKGTRTSWMMHEYRLTDTHSAAINTYGPPAMRFSKASSSMRLDDWVLCRLYKNPNQQLSLCHTMPPPPDMEGSGAGRFFLHDEASKGQKRSAADDDISNNNKGLFGLQDFQNVAVGKTQD